jgi:nucleoside-triphosphatase THEP1
MALYILSGSTGIGKTTTLLNWVQNRKDSGGFLSPMDNSIRKFYFISPKLFINMIADENETEILEIGKYKFSKAAFNKAILCLAGDWNDGKRICILDEYGPLEKNDTGLMPALHEIILSASKSESQDLIVVVREKLLEHFISKYEVANVYDLQSINGLFATYPDLP